jgi:CBS domain containing-hemolysin-like protein
MVPRIDICAASLDTGLSDLINLIKRNKYTRIPIYDGSIDNIIGIINIKDLFFDDVLMNSNPCSSQKFDINNYIRETLFTFEQKNLYELFSEMRSASISLAIVLDDYGAVSGVISLEDILEELVGEIRDEYDFDEEDVIRKVDNDHYLCSGQARIDEFNEFFGTNIASEDYESIGGVVIEHLDRLPNVGDTITINNFIIQVVRMDKKRIDRLIIRKK